MHDEIRVRFAPSPTGNVHIGNIRVAIFNWLFARRGGGKFLLRVEDTDRERSTPEAIEFLLDTMRWMGLDWDEEPVYQTKNRPLHDAALKKLEQHALIVRLKPQNSEAPPPYRFVIPFNLDGVPFVRETGAKFVELYPDSRVTVSRTGLSWVLKTKKGRQAENDGALAGFMNLKILNGTGELLFDLDENFGAVMEGGETFSVEGAYRLEYNGRELFYKDLVKGEIAKPLDSMRDFSVARGDGTPLFHLANVADDVEMRISHVLRGDGHVENTFKHLLLYNALGETPPLFGHFPMIVNARGKKLSKRDGDAGVLDFRQKGYLPEALFNFLALLGWNPGDEREVFTRREMAEAFSLERVVATPAQMNYDKLAWMNGQYIQALPDGKFLELISPYLEEAGVDTKNLDADWLAALADVMKPRIKTLYEFPEKTRYLFHDDVIDPDTDNKNVRKVLRRETVRPALKALDAALADFEIEHGGVEKGIRAGKEYPPEKLALEFEALCNSVAEKLGSKIGEVAQPLRVALTGRAVSPPIGETLSLTGAATARKRIAHLLRFMSDGDE